MLQAGDIKPRAGFARLEADVAAAQQAASAMAQQLAAQRATFSALQDGAKVNAFTRRGRVFR